ncbi:MAG TPA: Clp protease N-terminal domain-containing protein [Candidatus Dormibacteraeota bacterium]|jgi:ATP-dependent Clp protease ATP-binding subunit ClpC
MAHKYPFEAFSEDAKRTLNLAQEEAERLQSVYIGTEHVLLALLRLEAGSAHRALTRLDVDAGRVRRTIEGVLLRPGDRPKPEQVIPTSRVKRVIEIAFAESRRMRSSHVRSGHLLMGLAIEREGIAAHVLRDVGATVDAVVAAVESEKGPDEPGGETPDLRVYGPR